MLKSHSYRCGIKPLLSFASISLLAVTLAACGGSSSSSRAGTPQATLNADNAPLAVQLTLAGPQILMGLNMFPAALISQLDPEAPCLNEGQATIQTDAAPFESATFSQCLIQEEADQTMLLDGSIHLAINSQDGEEAEPQQIVFTYNRFAIEVSGQLDESSFSRSHVEMNGSVELDMLNQNINGDLVVKIAAAAEGEGAPPEANIQTEIRFSRYNVDQHLDEGLDPLQSVSGELAMMSDPLNGGFTIVTHEPWGYGCEYGDFTLKGRNSEINVRFTDDGALVTVNGVTETFEQCSDFGYWLESADFPFAGIL